MIAGYKVNLVFYGRIEVPTDGFRIHGKGQKAKLVPLRANGVGGYEPFDQAPGAFLSFCDARDPADVLGFANRYGSLAGNDPSGMSLREWERQRAELATIVQHWQDSDCHRVMEFCGLGVKERFYAKVERVPQLKLTTRERTLADWMVEAVNGFPLSFGADDSVVLVAQEMIDVMRAQLILSVMHDHKFHPCDYCGRQILLIGRRAKSRFCSAGCRTGHYKQRRADAVSRYIAGETAKELAKEYGLETSMVEKWIEEDLPNGTS